MIRGFGIFITYQRGGRKFMVPVKAKKDPGVVKIGKDVRVVKFKIGRFFQRDVKEYGLSKKTK
jgi:hypothetical protein